MYFFGPSAGVSLQPFDLEGRAAVVVRRGEEVVAVIRLDDHAGRICPMLQWAREYPLDGEPADVAERVAAYGDWMGRSADVPKLLMTVTPAQGLGSPDVISWGRRNISGLRIEEVGEAGHQAPEEIPDAIGLAVARWLEKLA
jgi:hypothetical protein